MQQSCKEDSAPKMQRRTGVWSTVLQRLPFLLDTAGNQGCLEEKANHNEMVRRCIAQQRYGGTGLPKATSAYRSSKMWKKMALHCKENKKKDQDVSLSFFDAHLHTFHYLVLQYPTVCIAAFFHSHCELKKAAMHNAAPHHLTATLSKGAQRCGPKKIRCG